jgi:NADH dehydrogenase
VESFVHILVLGGGFAGYYATRKLKRLLGSRPGVDFTLVSGDNFLLFTPLLHEVAASDVDPSNIVAPLHKYLPGIQVLVGQVQAIDLPNKQVTVTHGPQAHRHVLSYDYLVIALGSVSNFHHLPGVEENSITMKSLEDAFYLRNHMIRQLELAQFEGSDSLAPGVLTFVVCGGGFAGVETVGAMMDFLQAATKFYPSLQPHMIRVVLVHAGGGLLPELGGTLGTYALEKLRQRGVEVIVDAEVEGFREGAAWIKHAGQSISIATNALVWTAGVMPAPAIQDLSCEKDKSRLLTKPNTELLSWPGVFAVGDCAAIPRPGRPGEYYGPTAQNALRQGELAARNIAAAITGGTQRPFTYREMGQLASIGSRRGVAHVLGFRFSGFLAWWFWRTVYLYKLPGFQKKVRVALDWTLDVLFSKDIVQFRPPRVPASARPAVQPETTTQSERARRIA